MVDDETRAQTARQPLLDPEAKRRTGPPTGPDAAAGPPVVSAAGNQGIYVAVMLFEGWALHLSPPPHNVEGHPFYAANNVNNIGIRSIVEYQVLPLEPRVRALQEAYIRQVIDTVHDLPNVL